MWVRFNADGPRSTLATVTTLSALCLVLPSLTTSVDAPEFSGTQLAFAAVVSIVLYGLFVFTPDRAPPRLLPARRPQYAILALRVFVTAPTVIPGRATLMQAGAQLLVVASFVFFAIRP